MKAKQAKPSDGYRIREFLAASKYGCHISTVSTARFEKENRAKYNFYFTLTIKEPREALFVVFHFSLPCRSKVHSACSSLALVPRNKPLSFKHLCRQTPESGFAATCPPLSASRGAATVSGGATEEDLSPTSG